MVTVGKWALHPNACLNYVQYIVNPGLDVQSVQNEMVTGFSLWEKAVRSMNHDVTQP